MPPWFGVQTGAAELQEELGRVEEIGRVGRQRDQHQLQWRDGLRKQAIEIERVQRDDGEADEDVALPAELAPELQLLLL